MAGRKHGRPIHGWIVLDKPVGIGSTPALAAVRRAAGAEKAGHGGTLDPLASGVLPIALGEATKTVAWAMSGAKRYRCTIRWGVATATDDAEGAVTETSDERPTAAAIEVALPAFMGTIEQVPSSYSAIHVGGRRAYELARRGETVDLAPRQVVVDAFRLVSLEDADHATFEVDCGKGVYVRSLARDLAKALGTLGHLSALRRLKVGPFTVEHAISMEKLPELGHEDGLNAHLLPVETALDDIPALALTEAEAKRLRQGLSVLPSCSSVRARVLSLGEDTAFAVSAGGVLVAIARKTGASLRPVRVMNL